MTDNQVEPIRRTFASRAEWELFNKRQQDHHDRLKRENRNHDDGPCWRCCEQCGPDFIPEVILGANNESPRGLR